MRESDVLTVWREVHIEVDSMQRVDTEVQKREKELFTGAFENDLTAVAPATSTATITISGLTPALPGDVAGLKAGWLDLRRPPADLFSPTASYVVTDVKMVNASKATVTFKVPGYTQDAETLVNRAVGADVLPRNTNAGTLRSSDNMNMLPIVPLRGRTIDFTRLNERLQAYLGGIMSSDPTNFWDPASNVFALGYILPRFDGAGNARNNQADIPFEANTPIKLTDDGKKLIPDDGSKFDEFVRDRYKERWHALTAGGEATGIAKDDGYFSVFVVTVYQPSNEVDGDPQSSPAKPRKLFGATGDPVGISILFLETVRNSNSLPAIAPTPAPTGFVPRATPDWDTMRWQITAHELAHALGVSHSTSGKGIVATPAFPSPTSSRFEPVPAFNPNDINATSDNNATLDSVQRKALRQFRPSGRSEAPK